MLEEFVLPLINFIKLWVRKCVANKNYETTPEVRNVFLLLSDMIKVRGYKTVIKFFPHEVSDMEPVTEVLQNCSYQQPEMPYVLVLWLSIIVLVPFDLTTIDSDSQTALVKKIVGLALEWIGGSDRLRDGGAFMLARLITRPDVVKSGETSTLLEQLAVLFAS
jgi:hypothetical protein